MSPSLGLYDVACGESASAAARLQLQNPRLQLQMLGYNYRIPEKAYPPAGCRIGTGRDDLRKARARCDSAAARREAASFHFN